MTADQRLQSLLQFLSAAPHDPFNQYALAIEYVGRGDDETASPYFENLLAEHPSYLPTYYHYGKLAERAGRVQQATELYEAGIKYGLAEKNMHAVRELKEALAQIKGEDDDEF